MVLAAALGACGPSVEGNGDDGDDDPPVGGEADAAAAIDAAVRADAPPAADAGPDAPPLPGCGVLPATVRDFNKQGTIGGHVDFQAYWGAAPTTGIVQPTLGPDGKPAFLSTGAHSPSSQYSAVQVQSAATFAQFFNDTAGVNQAVPVELQLVEYQPGKWRYDKTGAEGFFPIDGMGMNQQEADFMGALHNFHFTTEIHTSFVYLGGETFTFSGDDDLWLFINNQLVIDLGGLHPQATGSVALDSLLLTRGQTYSMDIFHAERRSDRSNFSIETTISCLGPVD